MRRRATTPVKVGQRLIIGGDSPVVIQSMTSVPTMDTEGCVAQVQALAEAGCQMVRLTAQGRREATNLGVISACLKNEGCAIPLAADIHFNPAAAYAAVEAGVEKVRINPGNFVDPGRTFSLIEYTDEQYKAELKRLREALLPFLKLCRQHDTALRLGVNHGSLSDRIMSRYGNTPAGMVESAMEFLRVCHQEQFPDVVVSIKASNTLVMVQTVRLLVKAMESEGMSYPLHLGVTEAGDGEDGRIKSALGIGALLAQGIGDTIRVSLAEDPVAEIPVAKAILERVANTWPDEDVRLPIVGPDDVVLRSSVAVGVIGGDNPTVVHGYDIDAEIYPLLDADALPVHLPEVPLVITSDRHDAPARVLKAMKELSQRTEAPMVAKFSYPAEWDYEKTAIAASVDFGQILMAGLAEGVWINAPGLSQAERTRLSLGILQAGRRRFTKTEFIACPGCGRTMFDLRTTLANVREATGHLDGLKIGVMGCIVNGPGEMADADYGYVGASAGHVSLYKGKTCVQKNISQEEAIPRLIELIRTHGDWKEAAHVQ